MARWTVRSDDAEMLIDVTEDGRVSIEITRPGPFVVEIRKAEDMRIFVAAAIGIAHRVRGNAGPSAADARTGTC